MIRRVIIPLAAVAASLSVASVASAQTSPPTTLEVETSTVERTVTTIDSKQVDTDDDDDDSDKTGLWGLLGLLGLAGLAGLAKKKRDDTSAGYNTPVTGAAPKRADGATGSSGTTT